MSVVYIVFPLALLIAAGAVLAFVWAVRSGQLDDMETPAMRVLDQDDADPTPQRASPDSSRKGEHEHSAR